MRVASENRLKPIQTWFYTFRTGMIIIFLIRIEVKIYNFEKYFDKNILSIKLLSINL